MFIFRTHLYSALMLLIMIIFVTLCMGAEKDQTTVELEPMTVTGSPIIEGNRTDAFGSMKTVVTETQLEDLNAQDLETALRLTPGINMSRYNKVGSFGGAEGGGIFIRGMGTSRPGAEIKTLVDGVPMFMSVWNHPLLDLMSIDPSHAIEVYKSPQPQNFGNALGVVNIIPKRMDAPGFVTKGELSAGSFDTRIAKGEHGGNINGWDYYLGGGFRESKGHRDHSGGELKNIYGRIAKKLSDHWDLSLFTLWTDNWADDPGAEGADTSERLGRYETRAILTTATLSHQLDRAEGEVKLYRNNGEGDWLDQPTDTADVSEDLFNNFLFYGIKVKETLTITGGGELTTGVDWEYTEGDYSQEFSDGGRDGWDGDNFDLLMPYAALSWCLGTEGGWQWTPSVGVRYYEHSNFDSKWSPHAGLLATYGPGELHLGYSHGIVYPGLEVQVMSEAVLPVLAQSWQELSPEVVDHYEAGLCYKPTQKFSGDITFFREEGRDRYVIDPPPPMPPAYDNLETFTITGLEATFHWYPNAFLSFFGGLTYLDTDPSDLPYAPETTTTCGVLWRFLQHFKLSLDGTRVSKTHVNPQTRRLDDENRDTVDGYLLVNGKLSYDLDRFFSTYHGELFLAGENLTDVDYEYQPEYEMPGINFMVGVNVEI